jgi:hypothetical protein
MGEPHWLDEREARVWRAVVGLQQRLVPNLERQLIRDSGLSGADYVLLVPLSEAPDGLLRARDLGRMVGWERSRLAPRSRGSSTGFPRATTDRLDQHLGSGWRAGRSMSRTA